MSTSGAKASPAKQKSTTTPLKWHNTLPEDFSSGRTPRGAVTPSGRKRQSSDIDNSSPTLHRQRVPPSGVGGGGDSGGGSQFPLPDSEKASPHQHMFASPTKRRKPPASQQQMMMMKTPTRMGSGGSTGSVKSSGSGMATPPPTSTTSARKRGRPKKKDAIDGPRGMSPPPTSPMVSSRMRAQDPIPQPQFTNPIANSLQPTAVPIPSSNLASAKTPLWENPVELALELGVSPPDWPLMSKSNSNSNFGDLFNSMDTKDADKLSAALGIQDPMAFSFMASNDPMDSLPAGVDPNLIFGSYGSLGMGGLSDGSFGPDSFMFSDQPYQHQLLQQQLEATKAKEQEQQKIREQAMARELSKEAKRTRNPSILSASSVIGRANALEDPFKPSKSRKSKSKAPSFVNDENRTPPPGSSGAFFSDDVHSSRSMYGKQKLPTVLFSISPSGRAKTDVLESETEVEDNVDEDIRPWDGYLDSDSSFDDDTPRGLGPGGKEYPARTCYGSPSLMGSSRKTKLKRHHAMPVGMRTGWDSASDQQNTPHLQSSGPLMNMFAEREPKLPTIRNTPSLNSGANLRRRGRRPSQSSSAATPRTLNPEIDISLLNNNSPPKDNAEDDALYRLREIRAERQSSIQNSSSSVAPTPSHRSGNSDPNFPPSLYPTIGPSLLGLADSPDIRPSLSPPFSDPLFTPTPRRRKARAKTACGGPSSPVRHIPASPTPMPKRMAGKVPRHQPKVTKPEKGRIRCICNPEKGSGAMVYCNNCENLLHMKCVGLTKKGLQPKYTCIFCTGAVQMALNTSNPGTESVGMKVKKRA